MTEHHEHGPVKALRVQGGQPQQHEAHVRDRAVGDEFLEIFLHQGHARGVDDINQGQQSNVGSQYLGRFREESEAEAQHPVGAHF